MENGKLLKKFKNGLVNKNQHITAVAVAQLSFFKNKLQKV